MFLLFEAALHSPFSSMNGQLIYASKVSLVSVLNSAQAYSTLHFSQRVYCGSKSALPATPSGSTSPVTPLSSRTFGTWTLVQSVVRLYAAYNISNPAIYQLGIWTYGIAWAHFMSEWFIFKSTHMSAGLAGPVIVSTASLVWMFAQWGFYVQ